MSLQKYGSHDGCGSGGRKGSSLPFSLIFQMPNIFFELSVRGSSPCANLAAQLKQYSCQDISDVLFFRPVSPMEKNLTL